jgi:hypothetical protein
MLCPELTLTFMGSPITAKGSKHFNTRVGQSGQNERVKPLHPFPCVRLLWLQRQ